MPVEATDRINHLWNSRNTISMGMVIILAKAMIGPQSRGAWPKKTCMPTIYQRSLFQFFRNADEELVEQEDGEGVRDERDDLHLVAIDPGCRAVEPGEIVDHQQQRHSDRLERDDD